MQALSFLPCCFVRDEAERVSDSADFTDASRGRAERSISADFTDASRGRAERSISGLSTITAGSCADDELEDIFFTPPSSPRERLERFGSFCEDMSPERGSISRSISRSISLNSTTDDSPIALRTRSWSHKVVRRLTQTFRLNILPDFNGSWRCIHTWGLENFLRAGGASRFEVYSATIVSWPVWEFVQNDNDIVFTNHFAFGDMKEEFQVGGPEYISRDLHKNESRCKAFWKGEALVIDKYSDQEGHFRETRLIDSDGKLQFTLVAVKPARKLGLTGVSFGRHFVRKS